WWIFVPWAVALFRNFNFNKTLSFAAISPFGGIMRAYWLVLPENARFGLDMVECVTPWLAAVFVWILAAMQRAEVREQVEDKLENQTRR
ncbi:MAG TPA: hypothetical protein VLJ10_00825, partial [Candidatus Bathyarchaeia archaeon]|nr:hypothetical protein [Candidatus Bathyarchaeia archaeon]